MDQGDPNGKIRKPTFLCDALYTNLGIMVMIMTQVVMIMVMIMMWVVLISNLGQIKAGY